MNTHECVAQNTREQGTDENITEAEGSRGSPSDPLGLEETLREREYVCPKERATVIRDEMT